MSVLRYSANSRLSSSNVPSIKTRGMMGAIVGECEEADQIEAQDEIICCDCARRGVYCIT